MLTAQHSRYQPNVTETLYSKTFIKNSYKNVEVLHKIIMPSNSLLKLKMIKDVIARLID